MISLIIVNYRSAALARAAIASARKSSSLPIEAVVIDNSMDAREAEALRDATDVLIVSASNRGYAGGVNDARRSCAGEILLIANPDVVFDRGAIDLLAAALGDASAAGPSLFWDPACEWMLPPADPVTGWFKLDEILAGRSAAWRARRDVRRFRARVAFWESRAITAVSALSGAVLAVRAADFDALEGFDERFPLYFEETDFLRRLSSTRRRIAHVPGARCRHLYNQSAGKDAASSAALYAQSELRYLEKWNGPFAARVMKRLERPLPAVALSPWPGRIELDRDDVVVEVSPLASFTTAAGHFPRQRTVVIPAEVLSSVRSEALYARVVERASGRSLGAWRVL